MGGCGGERHADGPHPRPGDVGQGGEEIVPCLKHLFCEKDHVGADEFMGRTSLPLAKLTQSGKSDQWVRVVKYAKKRLNHYSGVTRRGNLWRGAAAVFLDACCSPKRRGPNSASGCRYFDQSLYTTSFRFMWTVAVFCLPFGVVSQILEFSFLSQKIKSRKLFQ